MPSDSFTASGTWTSPITGTATVYTYGAGGGGSRGWSGSGSSWTGGSSGGGGGFAKKVISVTQGVAYPVTVGVGGAAGTASAGSPGTAGGLSKFVGDGGVTVSANGGAGGVYGQVAAGGTGSGDVAHTGGSGAKGASSTAGKYGSGGGGCAGTDGNGVNGGAGTTTGYGLGGDPGSDANSLAGFGGDGGQPGLAYGGGGGGGYDNPTSAEHGYAGAGGYVLISYEASAPFFSGTPRAAMTLGASVTGTPQRSGGARTASLSLGTSRVVAPKRIAAVSAPLTLHASTSGGLHYSSSPVAAMTLGASVVGTPRRAGNPVAPLTLAAVASNLPGGAPVAELLLGAEIAVESHREGSVTAALHLGASVFSDSAAAPQAPGSPVLYRPRKPLWRYHAQNILTGEWLHRDLPLPGAQLTWTLCGPDTLSATIDPDLATAKNAWGLPLLDEWSTVIYAEEGDLIRHGSIVYNSDFADPKWALTTMGFAGYPNGMPYVGQPYIKTNYDPLDVVRDLWDYLQSQPDGNLGLQVDQIKSTSQVGNVKDDQGEQLTVPGLSMAPGVQLNQYAPANQDNQLWWISQPDWQGYVTIQNKNSGLYVDVQASSVSAGAPVVQWPWTGGDNQLWRIINNGSWVTIQNKHSGMVLNVQGASVANNAPVIQWPMTDADNSYWVIGTPDTDGYVTLANLNSGQITPYELDWWNNTDIGQEINNLAQSTPFDYWEEHSWADDAKSAVNHRLRLGFPRAGRRQKRLRFVEGENVGDVVTVQRHGDQYANGVVGLGAGQGSSMLRSDKMIRDGRLRRVLAVTDPSITHQEVLSSLTQGELDSRRILPEILACTVRQHPNAVIGSFGVGDDILVTVKSGWAAGTSIWSRITSYTVTPDDPAYIQLTLMRSDRFRYVGGITQGSASVVNG